MSKFGHLEHTPSKKGKTGVRTEWWVDDVTQKVCGPWSDVQKMDWPNHDYVFHAIDYDTFESVESQLRVAVEALEKIEANPRYCDTDHWTIASDALEAIKGEGV